MKILTSFCRDLDIVREILPDDEIRCLDEADEGFVESADVLLVFHWRDVEDLVPKMKNLRLIQTLTAGTDHIDFSEVPEGVKVQSNAGANARAVAEHGLSLLMAAMKRIPWRDREMRNGRFPQLVESRLLKGKTALILGFGHIGRELGSMLSCLGVKVFAINQSGRYEGEIPVERIGTIDELDDMLKEADAVFVTLPLKSETKGLIDRKRLSLMKKDAVLVNISRGKIVVKKDLYEHLVENPKFTAAIDVWWHYGKGFKQDYLFEELENIVLSPHCAGTYENWFRDIVRHAAERIKLWKEGKERNVSVL